MASHDELLDCLMSFVGLSIAQKDLDYAFFIFALFTASEITWFFYKLYLHKKLMDKFDPLHADRFGRKKEVESIILLLSNKACRGMPKFALNH